MAVVIALAVGTVEQPARTLYRSVATFRDLAVTPMQGQIFPRGGKGGSS